MVLSLGHLSSTNPDVWVSDPWLVFEKCIFVTRREWVDPHLVRATHIRQEFDDTYVLHTWTSFRTCRLSLFQIAVNQSKEKSSRLHKKMQHNWNMNLSCTVSFLTVHYHGSQHSFPPKIRKPRCFISLFTRETDSKVSLALLPRDLDPKSVDTILFGLSAFTIRLKSVQRNKCSPAKIWLFAARSVW